MLCIQKLDCESKKSILWVAFKAGVFWSVNDDTIFRTNSLLLRAPPPLVFFICFQDCGCDQCTFEFSQKKNACSACYALSATSGFLDSSSVCFSRQESTLSDAPAGELQFSGENMRPAAVSLLLKKIIFRILAMCCWPSIQQWLQKYSSDPHFSWMW